MIFSLTGKKAQIACGLLCCCSMAYAQSNDNSEVVILHSGWEFAQAGTELWRTAEVPGTVHQDLIHHKLLPSPFYGTNEQKIQWVENEDWEYRTSFAVTAEQLKRDDAQLIFEGLDTYADVYLNGSLLLKADNMFGRLFVTRKAATSSGGKLTPYIFSFAYPADPSSIRIQRI